MCTVIKNLLKTICLTIEGQLENSSFKITLNALHLFCLQTNFFGLSMSGRNALIWN